MFWESIPYSWPVVGWPSDIPAISKAQADEFYSLFYAPQNITLILIGDFKPDNAEKLARQYFERIPRGAKEAPEELMRLTIARAFDLIESAIKNSSAP